MTSNVELVLNDTQLR